MNTVMSQRSQRREIGKTAPRRWKRKRQVTHVAWYVRRLLASHPSLWRNRNISIIHRRIFSARSQSCPVVCSRLSTDSVLCLCANLNSPEDEHCCMEITKCWLKLSRCSSLIIIIIIIINSSSSSSSIKLRLFKKKLHLWVDIKRSSGKMRCNQKTSCWVKRIALSSLSVLWWRTRRLTN